VNSEQKAASGKNTETMRKKFIGCALSALRCALCLLGALLLPLCFPADAQQPKKVPRVGVLSPGSRAPNIDAFLKGLRELGWVEGQNIAIEYRWAEGNEDRLPALAAQLVDASVDVIVTTSPHATLAARQLTKNIPIVETFVNVGRLMNLGHPSGNVTGVSFMSRELHGKRLELLKEIIPRIFRVAVLRNVVNPGASKATGPGTTRRLMGVAQSLGVQIQSLNVKKPDEIENAFASMARGKADALLVTSEGMFVRNRAQVVELAAKNRLPATYPDSRFTDSGGLMSYGPNNAEMYHRAAYFVDRILKGAKPSDLPVEQPTKFEFVINLKAAEEIGLRIPPEVLMFADRVIK
jgi:putative tryptophan/tyrosine transport system substrate-binding protein